MDIQIQPRVDVSSSSSSAWVTALWFTGDYQGTDFVRPNSLKIGSYPRGQQLEAIISELLGARISDRDASTNFEKFWIPEGLSEQDRVEMLAQVFCELDKILYQGNIVEANDLIKNMDVDRLCLECSIGILRYLLPIRERLRSWAAARAKIAERLGREYSTHESRAMLSGM